MTEEAKTEEQEERSADDIDAMLRQAATDSELDAMQELATEMDSPETPEKEGDQDAKETPPEEKSEETAVEEKPVEEEQQQTQVEPEKQVETPEQHAFAEMRVNLKKEKEAREAAQQELKELREAQSKPAAPAMSVEQVVSALEKAKEGGFDTELDNALAIKNAREALRTAFNSKDLTQVLANAQQGLYGPEASQNIAAELSNAMQIVQSSEHQERINAETEQREEQEQQASTQSAYQEQLTKVKEEMPEFLDVNSALTKFSIQWDAKYLGKLNPDTAQIVEQGVYDQNYVNYLMSNPLTHAKIIKEAFAASQVHSSESQLAQLQEKQKKVENKIAQQDSVLPASAPAKSKTNERSANDISSDIVNHIRQGALV